MARIRTIKPEFWFSQQQAWSHGCALYVLEEEDTGFVKVGIAEHPLRRLSGLQGGNSRLLVLKAVYCGDRRDCRSVEKYVLEVFRADRIRGEWLKTRLSGVLSAIENFTEEGA